MDFTQDSTSSGAPSSPELLIVGSRTSSQTSVPHDSISTLSQHHQNTIIGEESIDHEFDKAVFIPDLEEDDMMEITETLDEQPKLGNVEDEIQNRPRHGYGQSFDFDLGERQTEVGNGHRMYRPRSIMGYNVTISAVNHMRGVPTEIEMGEATDGESGDIDRNGNPPTVNPGWVQLHFNQLDSAHGAEIMSFVDDMNQVPNQSRSESQSLIRRASDIGQTLHQEREQHRNPQESKLQWQCTRSAAGIAQHFSSHDIVLPLLWDEVDASRINACKTNLERANLWIEWRDQHHPLNGKRKAEGAQVEGELSSQCDNESHPLDNAASVRKKVKTGTDLAVADAPDAVSVYWETIMPPANRHDAREAYDKNTDDIDVATGMRLDGSMARNPDGTERVPLRKYQNRKLSITMHTSSSFTIKSKYGIPLSLQLLKDWNFYRPEMEKWKHPQIIEFWQEKGRWLDDKIDDERKKGKDNVFRKGIRDQTVEDLVEEEASDDSCEM